MKVLATYNIKGGVGKTATAVNLAWLSARDGARTLVWDLDPQGAASFYFRVKPKVKGGGKALVRGKRNADDAIKGTDYENLDLLPADFSYRNLDLLLDADDKPTRLRKLLKPLLGGYDRVILDCAPSISLVTENVLRAADTLLVPVIPTTLSLRTLEQLSGFVADSGLDRLTVLPFFSMVDRRKRLHREVMASLPTERPDVLRAVIAQSSDIEKMGLRRAPLCAYAPRSTAARAYETLWAEILEA